MAIDVGSLHGSPMHSAENPFPRRLSLAHPRKGHDLLAERSPDLRTGSSVSKLDPDGSGKWARLGTALGQLGPTDPVIWPFHFWLLGTYQKVFSAP